MFIGHYGVALAAKRLAPRTSLGWMFVAVQLLDVFFAIFVLTGVEKLRIVPGFTKTNSFDLYFLPYSHSLAGAILWSAVGALAYGVLGQGLGHPKERVLAALVFGGAVLSHYALDVPMHTPDLPLGFGEGSTKIGLGLWNQPDVTVALELGFLVAGGALYLQITRPLEGGRTATLVVGALLALIAIATPLLPPPADAREFAVQALGAYAAFALLAEWMDRKRDVVTA